MKISELSNTALRFLGAGIMLVVLGIFCLLQMKFPQIHPVRILGVLIALGAIIETVKCYKNATADIFNKHTLAFIGFLGLLILVLCSVYFVGTKPWIMLWLLMIIAGADIGAWVFGKLIGGDKMWERLSANKTWAGQIGGIICGTIMSVLFVRFFKPFGTDAVFGTFIGISFSLLSQYGDLTASFIKRCLGIKDFGNLLPGHGGILDRFDGWIYVLPFMWFCL